MHILQQDNHDEIAADEVVNWLDGDVVVSELIGEVADDLTEQEVAKALSLCKDVKACSLDRQRNGRNRQYATEIVAIPTILYNYWYDAGVFPESWLEADIFCLKKGGDNRGSTQLQPISSAQHRLQTIYQNAGIKG